MARFTACRSCGWNMVSITAQACPKCGARNKRSSVGTGILIAGVSLVAVIMFATLANLGRTRDSGSPKESSEPAIDVSPEQLRSDYKANEISADQRYRGKVLRVTGMVKAIKKDFMDDPYVVLGTSNMFEGVHARFEDAAGLSGLRQGSTITVRCIGNNVVLGSPMLKHCVLE